LNPPAESRLNKVNSTAGWGLTKTPWEYHWFVNSGKIQ
jgi:hypothetical protein